jgi:peroxin-16
LIYALSNLLVLFNDRIIHYSRTPRPEHGHKLKTFITVLEYAEVFLEISARKVWGERGKWMIIIIVQVFK